MNFDSIIYPLNLRNDVRYTLTRYFDHYLSSDMIVYDIGCGEKPFKQCLDGKVKSYVGVDIEEGFYDTGIIDIVGTAYKVPSPNNSVDAIISSQVIEHLDRPWDALKESNRLLKKEGYLFLSFPFLYPIHAEPHDYGRYTLFQIEKKLQEHGFKILEHTEIGGFFYCVGMFLGIYLKVINRGILKTLKISNFIIWFFKSIISILHFLETKLLHILKKKNTQGNWVVNYVLTAKKIK